MARISITTNQGILIEEINYITPKAGLFPYVKASVNNDVWEALEDAWKEEGDEAYDLYDLGEEEE